MEHLEVCTVAELQRRSDQDMTSLGVVIPDKVMDIRVSPVNPALLKQRKEMLSQQELTIFGAAPRSQLEPIPYEFRYIYECEGDDRPRRALITDWELGMRYRNNAEHMAPKEAAEEVKEYYMNFMDSTQYDARWFMGTTHQWSEWIVIGVFYPPKLNQPSLV